MIPTDPSLITDEAALRSLHPKPMSRATDKVLPALDRHCRQIIGLSPFCVIASQGPGGADVSPRGDPPGFVQILDDRTLLLPDRVGNNRLDHMVNLLANPRIGILFLVPGSVGVRSLFSMLDQEVIAGVETTFEMLLIAVSLVAGLLMANVVMPSRHLRDGAV